MCKFVTKAFEEGSFPVEMNKATITLIPKQTPPEQMSHLRPISLYNMVVKSITKIIANRLKPLMVKLVGKSKAVLFLAEKELIILFWFKKLSMPSKTGKKGCIAVKLDLEKAYDCIDWEFLRLVLQVIRINIKLMELIMFCISSTFLLVLWNREKLEPFKLQIGLRQGDLLSPYLFVLCMEVSQWIKQAVGKNVDADNFVERGTCAFSYVFFMTYFFLERRGNPKLV